MALGKQIISSGGEVAKVVAAGKKFKQALRHRLKYGLGKMIDRAVTINFARASTSNQNVILYAQFVNVLEIDKNRKLAFDLTP